MSPDIQTIRDRFGVAGELRELAFAPGYVVSDDGRAFSFIPCTWHKECPRELRPVPHQYGYRMARLHINKKAILRGIHQLVAAAFLPLPQPGQKVVRHLDGDPANNHVDNLAWGTQAENLRDAIGHGRTLKGTRNPNAKLNDRRVQIVRALAAEGFATTAIATFFGVNRNSILRALNREQWGHVNDEIG